MDGPNLMTPAGSRILLSRRTVVKAAGCAVAGSAMAGARLRIAPAASAAAAGPDLSAYPETLMTAVGYEFGLPARIAGGWVRVSLDNHGVEDHHALLFELSDGKTFDDLAAAAEQTLKDIGPGGVSDISAISALGTAVGGPGTVAPGSGSTVVLELAPGNYGVMCLIAGADLEPHYGMGMIHELAVSAPASATPTEPPAAVLEVDLADDAISGIPDTVSAGKQVWKIANSGDTLHEMVIAKIPEGFALQGILDAMDSAPATPAADDPAPRLVASGGCAPMSPGRANWVVANLAPGDYVAVCFVPDLTEAGVPYRKPTDMQPFTVS